MSTKDRLPEDVFTPKTIVSREMFARRNEPNLQGNPGLQDGLRNALRERGGQVLIYGDSGVGKSSLLKYAAEDEGMETLVIECFSSKAYDDLIEDAIRKLIDVQEIERTEHKGREVEGEASGTIKLLLTLRGRVKAEAATDRKFQVVGERPLDALLKAMTQSRKRLLVLDNFQNITNTDTRSLIAQTMEMMSDRSPQTGDIKIVVIGISEDAPSLLGGSGSFQRRTTEVGVPRMPNDEVAEILERGFGLLGIRVGPTALNEMVFYSDGFPFFAHLLGLEVARAARKSGQTVVEHALVQSALSRAAQGVDQSYRARSQQAFEASGEVRPRRRILEILSESGEREWKGVDVAAAWAAKFDPRDDYAFLHVALAQLTSEDFGRILKRSGKRKRYVYQFADPHMRPFLRITAFKRDVASEPDAYEDLEEPL